MHDDDLTIFEEFPDALPFADLFAVESPDEARQVAAEIAARVQTARQTVAEGGAPNAPATPDLGELEAKVAQRVAEAIKAGDRKAYLAAARERALLTATPEERKAAEQTAEAEREWVERTSRRPEPAVLSVEDAIKKQDRRALLAALRRRAMDKGDSR